MIRQTTLGWILGAAFLCTAIYVIKHEVRSLESRLKETKAAIARDRDATHVLNAEWTHLNQPTRIARLGQDLLHLQPLNGAQVLRMSDFLLELPPHATARAEEYGPPVAQRRPPPAPPVDDSVAAMIDRFKKP
jgi:hypothetical protein